MNDYERSAEASGFGHSLDGYMVRSKLVRQYSWAIPNEEAIQSIARGGPVLEVGAGGGYWGKLVKEAGGDIICTDASPWDNLHHPVEKMEASAAVDKYGRGRNILFVWPQTENWSGEALKLWTNLNRDSSLKLFYVGEGMGGCTGDEIFHQTTEERFWEPKYVSIPSWAYINDCLQIYKLHY